MALPFRPAIGLNPDTWLLVFQQLVGDPESLCNVSLTSRAWRSLSLPCLLQNVDLSSHNNGRVPEHESEILPVVYADFSADYRPRNLVPRQRAFLRLITARPGLAKFVKSLKWTLIWTDFEEDNLTEIDRQTWNVFSEMNNVTQLDLGSLHEICHDDFVRQNPTQLFPAVTDLRLLGWMHRGLVKAIVRSIDTSKLRVLKLDYLQDEGALPDGTPLPIDIGDEYAHTANKTGRSDVVDEDLFQRQEAGKACIFPGPMWLPLRLLSVRPLDSLRHLQVKVAHFSMNIDLRNYHTLFRDTAALMLKVRESLTSLVIIFGEHPNAYEEYRNRDQCGTSRSYQQHTYRPWCIRMAAAFLNQSVAALGQSSFPLLEDIHFEGFHILESASLHEAAAAQLSDTFQSIQDYSFDKAKFTGILSLDHRRDCLGIFRGHDCATANLNGVIDLLRRS